MTRALRGLMPREAGNRLADHGRSLVATVVPTGIEPKCSRRGPLRTPESFENVCEKRPARLGGACGGRTLRTEALSASGKGQPSDAEPLLLGGSGGRALASCGAGARCGRGSRRPAGAPPPTLPFLSPEWPWNVRVGANSPSLCPTMFSVTKTGTNLRPLCTANVRPTASGRDRAAARPGLDDLLALRGLRRGDLLGEVTVDERTLLD